MNSESLYDREVHFADFPGSLARVRNREHVQQLCINMDAPFAKVQAFLHKP